MEVILYRPEIPQNTGNIARTCMAIGARLILIRPLGFSLSSRMLKRAGMDYLTDADISIFDEIEPFLGSSCFFFSTKASRPYSEISFNSEARLIFGSESGGLPSSCHQTWKESFYTIPMRPGARSLNLSNAAAIVLYEAWRQLKFQTS